MTDNQLQPIDYAHAEQLIEFCHPDRTNISAANSVLGDLYNTRRMPQTLVALARITARFCPDLNTDAGKAALAAHIAQLIDIHNQEDK